MTDAAAEARAVADAERFRVAGADAPGFAETLETAPALLLVLADLAALAAVDRDLPRYTLVGGASIYPFVWSVLLAARAEGLGGVTTTRGDPTRGGPACALRHPRDRRRRRPRRPGPPVVPTDPAAARARQRLHVDRPLRGHTTRRALTPRPTAAVLKWGMAQNVLGEELEPCNYDPVTGFYPRRLLQHGRGGRRCAHRVHPGDRGIPGLLGLGRQRPVHPASRIRLRRVAARGPVVPVRARAGRRPSRPGRRRPSSWRRRTRPRSSGCS